MARSELDGNLALVPAVGEGVNVTGGMQMH